MLPTDLLLAEHRLIERVIPLLRRELDRARASKRPDLEFIDGMVDFFRAYADACHHAKEERILMAAMQRKGLAEPAAQTVSELVQEHAYVRRAVGRLLDSRLRYARGDGEALDDILTMLETLAEFYPSHIAREEQELFPSCMDCFRRGEKLAMVKDFHEFDRKLIHEQYGKVVSEFEALHPPVTA